MHEGKTSSAQHVKLIAKCQNVNGTEALNTQFPIFASANRQMHLERHQLRQLMHIPMASIGIKSAEPNSIYGGNRRQSQDRKIPIRNGEMIAICTSIENVSLSATGAAIYKSQVEDPKYACME